MRILIVSSGLKPEHFGGLPSHVEDLIQELSDTEEKVAYLNVGAKSKWPWTRLWQRNDLPCPAWNLSSKLSYAQYWNGTQNPLSQIKSENSYRQKFLKVIEQYRPELVHFHELTSFPVELLKELKRRNVATVFSTADFYALCPTVKLFRPDHSFCTRLPDQLDCNLCSLKARPNRSLQWTHVIDAWLSRFHRSRNLLKRIVGKLDNVLSKPAPADQFIERRHSFERILRGVDLILTTSRAQQKIFSERISGWNIQFLQRSRRTIKESRPEPRTKTQSSDKVIFLALNIVNPAKGISLLEKAFADLQKDHPEAELHLYGLKDGTAPGIRYFGPYDDSQLDSIIGSADFGILPSIWPEAFGYVGPEMLSRGLPVIASNRGAMPDYVVHEENGMLFDPEKTEALTGLLRRLIREPHLRQKLWHGAARNERLYPDMKEHTQKLREIYRNTRESSCQ